MRLRLFRQAQIFSGRCHLGIGAIQRVDHRLAVFGMARHDETDGDLMQLDMGKRLHAELFHRLVHRGLVIEQIVGAAMLQHLQRRRVGGSPVQENLQLWVVQHPVHLRQIVITADGDDAAFAQAVGNARGRGVGPVIKVEADVGECFAALERIGKQLRLSRRAGPEVNRAALQGAIQAGTRQAAEPRLKACMGEYTPSEVDQWSAWAALGIAVDRWREVVVTDGQGSLRFGRGNARRCQSRC